MTRFNGGTRNLEPKTPTPVLRRVANVRMRLDKNERRMKELEETIDECCEEFRKHDAG